MLVLTHLTYNQTRANIQVYQTFMCNMSNFNSRDEQTTIQPTASAPSFYSYGNNLQNMERTGMNDDNETVCYF